MVVQLCRTAHGEAERPPLLQDIDIPLRLGNTLIRQEEKHHDHY